MREGGSRKVRSRAGRPVTRRLRAVLVAGALGVGLAIAGPATAADADTGGGMPPDLGLYCKLATPQDTSGTLKYFRRDGGYTFDRNGNPTCTYWMSTSGSTGKIGFTGGSYGRMPAATVPYWQSGGWGPACRATWGRQSYAEHTAVVPFKSGGGPVECKQIDYDAYEQASRKANQPG